MSVAGAKRWLASYRVRSYAMVLFYIGITLVGLAGVFAPSQSAVQALPDRALVILWTLCYGLMAPIAAYARLRRIYDVELLCLLVIIGGTVLHGAFLISTGMPGLQTGFRLIAGAMALVAVASAITELARADELGQAPVIDRTEVERIVADKVAQLVPRDVEDDEEDDEPAEPDQGPRS